MSWSSFAEIPRSLSQAGPRGLTMVPVQLHVLEGQNGSIHAIRMMAGNMPANSTGSIRVPARWRNVLTYCLGLRFVYPTQEVPFGSG